MVPLICPPTPLFSPCRSHDPTHLPGSLRCGFSLSSIKDLERSLLITAFAVPGLISGVTADPPVSDNGGVGLDPPVDPNPAHRPGHVASGGWCCDIFLLI